MLPDYLVRAFSNASRALATGAKDTGFTSNGLRKLDFFVRERTEEGKERSRVFTAIQQNPNKLSVPGKLAREGHTIIQIRDNDAGALVGNMDVTENRFNSYENIPQPVEIGEIEEALGGQAVRSSENVAVTAARTASPIDFTDVNSPTHHEVGRVEPPMVGVGDRRGDNLPGNRQDVQSPQGPEFTNRPGSTQYDGDSGKKAA